METVEWIRLDGRGPVPPKGEEVLAFWPDGDMTVEANAADGPGFYPGYSPGGMLPIAWARLPGHWPYGADGWSEVGGPRDYPEPGERVLAQYPDGSMRADCVYMWGGGARWLEADWDGGLPDAWRPLPSPPEGWELWGRLVSAEALQGILAAEMKCLREDLKRGGVIGDAAASALEVLRMVDGIVGGMPTLGHAWGGGNVQQ